VLDSRKPEVRDHRVDERLDAQQLTHYFKILQKRKETRL
jgi:hypothetical protein